MVIEATVTEKNAKVFIVTFVTLPKVDSKYLYFFSSCSYFAATAFPY